MSSIITVTDLETYTSETLDAGRAAQVVAAANDHIESVTGRSFGEVKTADETHDYNSVIFLRHPDVVSVTKVERGQGTGTRTTVDVDSYFWNEQGRLVLNQGRNYRFSSLRDYVHITYTYGTTKVPSDLKLAALSMASDFYDFATEHGTEVSQESIGSYQQQYVKGEASTTGLSHLQAINRYKAVRI